MAYINNDIMLHMTLFQKQPVEMISIEQWRGRVGGFAGRLASSTWAVSARARRRVPGLSVMTVHPLLVMVALAFFAKLQVEVPGTSQVPGPMVAEMAPGQPPLLLTPMSGTVLDPGLGETMVTSTTKVKVLYLAREEELDPGPEPVSNILLP